MAVPKVLSSRLCQIINSLRDYEEEKRRRKKELIDAQTVCGLIDVRKSVTRLFHALLPVSGVSPFFSLICRKKDAMIAKSREHDLVFSPQEIDGFGLWGSTYQF